jgi:hypothetical protein
MLRIAHIGDIVGSPGRKAFARTISRLRDGGKVDVVVVNAENAAGGRGLTPALAEEIFSAGADVITLGDHTWDQKTLIPYLPSEPRILRPANFPPDAPGKGYVRIETPKGPVAVLCVIGRVFMPAQDCPFRTADHILKTERPCPVIVAEIHAEATSEKIAFGRYLDGRVTSVAGTHTHVQTSDEIILPRGTAYITDLGMTGPKDSVLGREVTSIVKRFIDGLPGKAEVATDMVALEGIILQIDEKNGRVRKITRMREVLDAEGTPK